MTDATEIEMIHNETHAATSVLATPVAATATIQMAPAEVSMHVQRTLDPDGNDEGVAQSIDATIAGVAEETTAIATIAAKRLVRDFCTGIRMLSSDSVN